MANVRVLFTVSPKTPCDNLYIVGSTSSLGYWNPKKATQLKYNAEINAFVATKILPAGETVEYHLIKTIAHEVRHSYQWEHQNDNTDYGRACKASFSSYQNYNFCSAEDPSKKIKRQSTD